MKEITEAFLILYLLLNSTRTHTPTHTLKFLYLCHTLKLHFDPFSVIFYHTSISPGPAA